MATLKRTMASHRPLDFSPHSRDDIVLDLSCSKRQLTVEGYYSTYNEMKYNANRNHDIRHLIYSQNHSPDSTSHLHQYDEQQNRRMSTPDRVPETTFPQNASPDKSPSLYKLEVTRPSPQTSPNYAACYQDGLKPQLLRDALYQRNIFPIPQKIDRDDISETGSEGSSTSALPVYGRKDGKAARPFKAYPKDPFSLAAGYTTADAILNTQSAEKYTAFREKMLKQIYEANGGQATISNPKMRRTVNTGGYSSEDGKSRGDDPSRDGAYFERRKKNNEAAKKSRDRRRIKEDEIAIRAAFLERENIELKFELAAAKKQLSLCGFGSGEGSVVNVK